MTLFDTQDHEENIDPLCEAFVVRNCKHLHMQFKIPHTVNLPFLLFWTPEYYEQSAVELPQ